MSTVTSEITKIISANNPAAPFMTHALAELGNGSMQAGLKRIVNYYARESALNLKVGRIQGGIIGVLATTAIGGGIAYWYCSHQKNELKKEGEEILNTLQKPVGIDKPTSNNMEL